MFRSSFIIFFLCLAGFLFGQSDVTLFFTHDEAGARIFQNPDCAPEWFEEGPLPLAQVELFPNPMESGTDVNFTYTLLEEGTLYFSLYNALGQEFGPLTTVDGLPGVNHHPVKTQELKPGIYFFRVGWDGYGFGAFSSSTRSQVFRIVITR